MANNQIKATREKKNGTQGNSNNGPSGIKWNGAGSKREGNSWWTISVCRAGKMESVCSASWTIRPRKINWKHEETNYDNYAFIAAYLSEKQANTRPTRHASQNETTMMDKSRYAKATLMHPKAAHCTHGQRPLCSCFDRIVWSSTVCV